MVRHRTSWGGRALIRLGWRSVELSTKQISKHAKKIKALDSAVTKDGFQLVTLLRAAVVMPFQIVSVMLGFTSVPLGTYAVGTAAGLIPSSLPYLYAGSLSAAAGQDDADGGLVQLACNGLGLVATVLVMYKVGSQAQKVLDEALAKERVSD